MTRVIHTGDTHIGYRQYHRPERRQDFLDAFERVVEDAVDAEVDALVHAGDLFHDRRPDLTDILGTLAALRRLDDAGVPFLAVVGNHEGKRDAQWLDLFASLGLADRLGDEPRVVGDTAFYGLDFVPRSRREDLTYDFSPHDAEFAALVAHGQFAPLAPATDWDVREVLRESSVGFDAALLGDEHAHSMDQLEGAWVTYCGSTERASADEREDRGYNLVDFDAAEGEVRISRRGLPTREFVFVDVALGPGEGADRVREQVSQHDLDGAVVVVSIEGDGERVTPASIEEFATDRGALVARVTDRREFEEVEEQEVRFADPDEAVRERVRELGLSDAARDVDETIRASKVADANVADEVERRVRDLLEDPDAFTPAEDGAGAADDGNEDGDGDERAASGSAEADAESGGTDAGPGESTTGTADEEDATDAGARETAATAGTEGAVPDDGPGSGEDESAGERPADVGDGGDGQTTWGEFE
jgi:DNA repair exonuclease SbcCD nuclease subunit